MKLIKSKIEHISCRIKSKIDILDYQISIEGPDSGEIVPARDEKVRYLETMQQFVRGQEETEHFLLQSLIERSLVRLYNYNKHKQELARQKAALLKEQVLPSAVTPEAPAQTNVPQSML